jgi:hypothetical protein
MWQRLVAAGDAVTGTAVHVAQEVRVLGRLVRAIRGQLGEVVGLGWRGRGRRRRDEPELQGLELGGLRRSRREVPPGLQAQHRQHVQRQRQRPGDEPSVTLRTTLESVQSDVPDPRRGCGLRR